MFNNMLQKQQVNKMPDVCHLSNFMVEIFSSKSISSDQDDVTKHGTVKSHTQLALMS